MNQLIMEHSTLKRVQADNSSEFVSKSLDRWAYEHGVTMDFPALANQPTIPISNCLTAHSGMSASTSTGF